MASNKHKIANSVKSNKKNPQKFSVDFVLKQLKKHYPDAHCALNYSNPFELLIATILSAQCTDERVNKVTPELFKKYSNPLLMSKASVLDIEKLIHSTGFYKNKSKNIKNCCEMIVEKHNGKVPSNMADLVLLAGVGRKTANVVLGNAFGISSGIVVDTHVTRLVNRWGLLKSNNAVIIEKKLNSMVPQTEWIMFSHYLISHGRALCKAKNPSCENCFLFDQCPQKGVK